ncbi:hypothetical protein HRI_000420200 [Hibiscus trionum]|uniref:Retrotransposon Copia-like N-terminal domain-containing protein n=1 Tax=Hibiscus trionum TaxID=183268 RepID=A0A9W7GXS4_HIBTR|nr:hypothetical protein HRI_000420200 [Hibiscus trionum]
MGDTENSSETEISQITQNHNQGISQGDLKSSLIITNHRLDGKNFLQWSQSVLMVLRGRGKIGYINGEIPRPASTDSSYATWELNNSMVMAWLINSMEGHISRTYLFFKTAKEMWDAIKENYSDLGNASQVFEIKLKLKDIRQGTLEVTQYYNNLKILWQELDMYYEADWGEGSEHTKFMDHLNKERLYEFLAGLNRDLDEVRGRILGRTTLPTIGEAVAEVRREEKRRLIMLGDTRELKPLSTAGHRPPENSALISRGPQSQRFKAGSDFGSNRPWLFEVYGLETNLKLLTKQVPPLQDAGPQKCLAFSVDGSRFATGGVDGHLRILEWPSLRIIVDEVRAQESFQDMDFSLDSEFLASTSTDGSARIWKADDGIPLTTLARNSDEKIKLCRFSQDGTKPFLFCAVQKGNKAVTAVYDISTWNKIGHKRLLIKPASIMSVSLDGKYLALGSKDGDICVVEVNKMEISHWSKRLHPGEPIASLEFCPSQRVVLTTSSQQGAMVTKLNVPADWKEWQIYLMLLGLFLASAVVFYVFFQKSDSFWNFPLAREQQARLKLDSFLGDAQSEDVFGPLDM